MADDAVTLSIPASTDRVRLARVLAATLADEAGFDYDEVEDVRIAVDELCFALLDAGPTTGTLDLTASRDDGSLRIDGTCSFSAQPTPSTDEASSELTAQILSTVVDEYDVSFDGTVGRFRLVKTRS
ncbi:ATP-binding protein [Actinomarinicola tropica]|uniref:ATP-binding protein n=1 Tax=Actinomarinicola tropica TaxID=2789776 RepID=UPI00189B8C5E|nr:hypothetical protein [Actinomarinicola tropica]